VTMRLTYGAGFQPLAVAVEGKPLVRLDPLTGELVCPFTEPLQVRAWIVALARRLMVGETKELDIKHTFLDGMYMREMFIPKGTLLVGKVHRQACINVVSKGDISVLTETGSARVKAGYSIVSPAGIQKVGFAHEDTVFVNVFRTDETDPEKVESVVAIDPNEGVDLCQLDG